MPFTRISLNQGKSPDYAHAVSAALHQALVEAFEVPPHDKFQAIHQHCPGELMFERARLRTRAAAPTVEVELPGRGYSVSGKIRRTSHFRMVSSSWLVRSAARLCSRQATRALDSVRSFCPEVVRARVWTLP